MNPSAIAMRMPGDPHEVAALSLGDVEARGLPFSLLLLAVLTGINVASALVTLLMQG
jgi:hypothetical protein